MEKLTADRISFLARDPERFRTFLDRFILREAFRSPEDAQAMLDRFAAVLEEEGAAIDDDKRAFIERELADIRKRIELRQFSPRRRTDR